MPRSSMRDELCPSWIEGVQPVFKGQTWRLVGKGTPWALSSQAGEGDDFPHPSTGAPGLSL